MDGEANLETFDEGSLRECTESRVQAVRNDGVTKHFQFDGDLDRDWVRKLVMDVAKRQNQYLHSHGTKPEPSNVMFKEGKNAVLIVARDGKGVPGDAAEITLVMSNGDGGGRRMVYQAQLKAQQWGKAKLILKSVPSAVDFYLKFGFKKSTAQPDQKTGLWPMELELLQAGGFPRSERR